ncbi:MAG TPA: methyl-accepting chemotaxis protein [Devosia sp.]|nr:methyl-accepting chemotaxis protein [Devosia sp.]
MFRDWTFGRKVGLGFGAVIALTLFMTVIAVSALRYVVEHKDAVITIDSPFLVKATQLQTIRQQLTSSLRNFLLSNDPADIDALATARQNFDATVDTMIKNAAGDPEGTRLATAIATTFQQHTQAVDSVVNLRRSGADIPEVLAAYDAQLVPPGTALSAAITEYYNYRQQALEKSREESSTASTMAENIILSAAAIALGLAVGIALQLTRNLTQQIGSAVKHVESSSAELQSAANQQATGVKEQVTSMNEINTTISELLATSRQIAESAQRVSQIAEQTTSAAQSGDGTVSRATDSISGIRHQVDQVVAHMLELGRKSQEIGSVLDIVSELAEQTNILSINATIEAAGAGESGKRFSVVADEIRKLADRVASSAKEIRSLIDDVRSSVNTTVMATETGSKAVDAGSRQFTDVANLFSDIARLITTTTEAAREIELSTKQQATAVEQVNIAIANVAQATKETEASAGQTIQTASELASTSRDLLRLVQKQAAA